MYLSRSFVLCVLPLLSLAHITIPIAKHGQKNGRRSVVDVRNAHYNRNGVEPLKGVFRRAFWAGTIGIGTPSTQPFIVGFDTGSSDLFVSSIDCISNCPQGERYNASASSTSHHVNGTFRIKFVDQSKVTGNLYTDVVEIAGMRVNQTFAAANNFSSSFQNLPTSGLVGMGFPSLARTNSTPLFHSLLKAGKLNSSVFSFNLSVAGSETLDLGVDISKFRNVAWVNLTKEKSEWGHWQVILDKMVVDNTTVATGDKAIVDTGTTQIVGSLGDADLFYRPLRKYGAYQFNTETYPGLYALPCNSTVPVELAMGGKNVKLSMASFLLGNITNNGRNTGDCLAGVAGNPSIQNGYWILGDVFLSNFVSLWDVASGRVRFGLTDA